MSDSFRICPLGPSDDEPLFAALTPEVWRLAPTPFGRSREEFDRYLQAAREGVADGTAEVFTVLLGDLPVGMTRLHAIDRGFRGADLGYTWYRQDLWGSGINAFTKLALLRRAFEELDLIRITLRIDARNERSQRAVARLGAHREGVLRHDRILPDGFIRDTVVFSILRAEWPTVQAGLKERLAALKGTPTL
ncbi:N-acetyltransferase [bacterium]|nr:MAG: N-acetyltransferase [bacterium]